MNPYWLKIGGGALAIFGVGFTGITVAKKGIHEIKTVASATVQETLRDVSSRFLTFRLNGTRMGRLKSLDVTKGAERSNDMLRMLVALDDGVSADQLKDCKLATEPMGRRDDDIEFRCASKDEIDDEALTEVGKATFEPLDLSLPIYIPERDLKRLDASELRNVRASLSSSDGKSVQGNADYDVQDHHGRRQKGTVRLDASDGRALIEVRDDQGRELFRLNADDRGVSLNATDRRGRALLRLLAGDAGVHLDVNGK